MKCIVCRETIKSGQSRCSFCGFPVITGTAGTDAERQAISDVGASYYRAQMKEICIDLVTYQYQYEDGHLKPAGENELRIFDGAVLSGEAESVIPHETEKIVDNITEKEAGPGINEAQTKILWHSQRICQLEDGQIYELYPKITCKNQVRRHQVKIKAPKVAGYTYAGVAFEAGFNARLIIGDEKNYSCSEKFCLIQ